MATFNVTLITEGEETVIQCDEDTYIIDAAEEAGIELPYSCRSGSCSSCAGKVESGTVDNSEQNFLEESQVAEGFILTCVAFPKSDCTITTHMEEDLE